MIEVHCIGGFIFPDAGMMGQSMNSYTKDSKKGAKVPVALNLSPDLL